VFNKATCFDLVGYHQVKTRTIRHERKVQLLFAFPFMPFITCFGFMMT